MRARSKLLFGNQDRLEVAHAIAVSPDGVVNATDLSWELRIANNRVRSQLLTFLEIGLLVDAGQGVNGKRMYVRVHDPFWQRCIDWHQEWSQ